MCKTVNVKKEMRLFLADTKQRYDTHGHITGNYHVDENTQCSD